MRLPLIPLVLCLSSAAALARSTAELQALPVYRDGLLKGFEVKLINRSKTSIKVHGLNLFESLEPRVFDDVGHVGPRMMYQRSRALPGKIKGNMLLPVATVVLQPGASTLQRFTLGDFFHGSLTAGERFSIQFIYSDRYEGIRPDHSTFSRPGILKGVLKSDTFRLQYVKAGAKLLWRHK